MTFEDIPRLALGKPGDAPMPTIVPLAMPSLPPDIGEWLQPELLVGVLGLFWYEIKAGEARTTKRLDDMEARQRQDVSALKVELKADNRALTVTLDRLIEILLTAKPQA